MKRTPLNRAPSKKQVAKKKAERAAMKKYWISKADELGIVYCEETDQPVGREEEFNPYVVCHILGKGADTTQRSNPENYIILTAFLHDVLDFRLDADPNSKNHISKKLPNTYERILETKQKLKS